MRIIITSTLCLLILLASNALAESINGRLGFTGKVGFIMPLKDLTINGYPDGTIDTGFAGGGGLIYGLNDNFALELDVTHAPSSNVTSTWLNVGDLQTTDISFGIQYRFMPKEHLVPYVGVGADFITGDIQNASVDWSYGGHVSVGVDYFLNKNIALTADFKYVIGSKSDIELFGITRGKYDPMSFIGTFGVRLYLSENWSKFGL